MKLFLSFLQGRPDHPIPAYSFWEYYIKKGIEEAGYEWDECAGVDWAQGLVPQSKESFNTWKTKAWTDTLAYLKKNPATMFISYLYPHQIDISAIQQIKHLGIPCINFFCDNVRLFNRIPSEYAVFDLNWVPEYSALEMYKQAGYPHIHLPMPMWVAPEHRILQLESDNEIAFIGSRDIQRQLLFEEILSKSPELNLNIYGHAWQSEEKRATEPANNPPPYSAFDQINFQFRFIKEQGITAYYRKLKQRNFTPPLTTALLARLRNKPGFDEYIRITQQSMAVTGVNRYPSFRHPFHKPGTYSRLRDLEAPMLGACYLTEATEGLDYLYEPGKEIMVYKDADEFIDTAQLIIQDAGLRKRLRLQGQSRALSEHSIPQILKKLVNAL